MSNARNLSKIFPLNALVAIVDKLVTVSGLATLSEQLTAVAALSPNVTAINTIAVAGAIPTGVSLDFRGTEASVPTGFLLEDGRAVSRTTYAALFAVLGIFNGAGDGSTTFNLPDSRGRVTAGKDNMGGTAANRLTATSGVAGNTLGAAGGTEMHTLSAAQMPSHGHTATATTAGAHVHSATASHLGVFQNTVGTGEGVYIGSQATNTTSAGDHSHTITVNASGSGAAHPNVQPTLVANKIIKT